MMSNNTKIFILYAWIIGLTLGFTIWEKKKDMKESRNTK